MAPRPELQAPPEIFYNDEEARKYTSSSRISDIQRKSAKTNGQANNRLMSGERKQRTEPTEKEWVYSGFDQILEEELDFSFTEGKLRK